MSEDKQVTPDEIERVAQFLSSKYAAENTVASLESYANDLRKELEPDYTDAEIMWDAFTEASEQLGRTAKYPFSDASKTAKERFRIAAEEYNKAKGLNAARHGSVRQWTYLDDIPAEVTIAFANDGDVLIRDRGEWVWKDHGAMNDFERAKYAPFVTVDGAKYENGRFTV